MEEPSLLVSVVIMTKDRLVDLGDTLSRIGRYEYPHLEVVVVDNGSSDGTPDWLAETHPEVRLISLGHNVGTKARNIGVEAARGEFVAFQDDDSFFLPGSLGGAVSKLRGDPRLAIVAAREIRANPWQVAEYLHHSDPAAYEEESVRGRPTAWFCGCGAVARRDALIEVGGFPSDFFWGHEEVDLTTRLLIAGWDVRYFPDVVVVHRKSGGARNADLQVFYPTRNVVWYWWRYFPTWTALRLTLTELPLYYGSYSVYRAAPLGFLRAMVALFRSIPYMRSMRRPVSRALVGRLRIDGPSICALVRGVRMRRARVLSSAFSSALERWGGNQR